MAWHTVDEYAKLERITIQGVYKRVNKQKVKTMKGEHGQTLVWKDAELSNSHIIASESTDLVEININTQLEMIKDFFESSVNEIKLSKEAELNTLKESIQTIKESFKKIENMKDQQLDKQSQELKALKENFEKIENMKGQQADKQSQELKALKEEISKLRERNFFKRLFGD